MFREINEIDECNEFRVRQPKLMNVTYNMERVELDALRWDDVTMQIVRIYIALHELSTGDSKKVADYILNTLRPLPSEEDLPPVRDELAAMLGTDKPALTFEQENVFSEGLKRALWAVAEEKGIQCVHRNTLRDRGGVWWQAACKVAWNIEAELPHVCGNFIFKVVSHRRWQEVKQEWR